MNYAIVRGTGNGDSRRVAFGQVVQPDNVIYFLKLSHAGDKLKQDGDRADHRLFPRECGHDCHE